VDETAEVVNKTIEQELRKERIAERRTIKVLLLGMHLFIAVLL
jgi:uncharacterized membrane protein